MKLSDAILLGSTLITSHWGSEYYSSDGGGCARGMALEAIGKRVCSRRCPNPNVINFFVEWSWTWFQFKTSELPCGCIANTKYALYEPDEYSLPLSQQPLITVGAAITHIFDRHVHHQKNWTLDKLVDWVRYIEPKDNKAEENSGQEVDDLATIST